MLDKLEGGRESYRRRAWADAHRHLSGADRERPLAVEDLERLATCAYLIGRDDEFARVLERAHHECLNAGDTLRASRCAFWLGLCLLVRGEMGPATGWLGRAERLLDGRDCVERGYLRVPAAEKDLAAGNLESAYAAASEAASLGERFDDSDLVACARHMQGRALLAKGEVHRGLALLDEAMVSVTAGELSPILTGLIYCSVIAACQQAYAVGRAHEWTDAMAQWCRQQRELVAFTTTCLVHRAEILQLQGAWPDALEEARRACERFQQRVDRKPPGAAFYQEGEVHRLRGDYAAAEDAYRSASRGGCEPQPGLALLRLAQGRVPVAAAGLRRVLSATSGRLQRARLLPAWVEISLASRATEEARDACRELEDLSESFDITMLRAMAAHARGEVALAEGAAQAALGSLRRARQAWEELEVPYETARVRVLTAIACRALEDEEGGALELEAARTAFERLGAAPDVARVVALEKHAPSVRPHGLTSRELQVLRLVATGKTNKAIAAELFLSEKTIDRHVSNIFNKLDVSSRAAATAYAYEHDLL